MLLTKSRRAMTAKERKKAGVPVKRVSTTGSGAAGSKSGGAAASAAASPRK